MLDEGGWDYPATYSELYQFLLPILAASLSEIVSRVEEENGFEAYRRVAEEKDEIPDNIDFHVELEVQAMGGVKAKDLKATRAAVINLALKAKEYREKVGEHIDESVLKRAVNQSCDVQGSYDWWQGLGSVPEQLDLWATNVSATVVGDMPVLRLTIYLI